MMKHTFAFLLAGVLTSGVVLAADVDLSKLPPPSKKQGITFAKDIEPIFKAHSCVHCHSGERPKHRLRLDTLANTLKGGSDGKVVIPGNSEKSKLVIAVARLNPKTAMPPERHFGRGPGMRGRPGGPPPNGGPGEGPGGPPPMGEGPGGPRREMGPPPKPLTSEQVGLIRAWIDQGAK